LSLRTLITCIFCICSQHFGCIVEASKRASKEESKQASELCFVPMYINHMYFFASAANILDVLLKQASVQAKKKASKRALFCPSVR